jgi:hypothetical protein
MAGKLGRGPYPCDASVGLVGEPLKQCMDALRALAAMGLAANKEDWCREVEGPCGAHVGQPEEPLPTHEAGSWPVRRRMRISEKA